MEGNLIEAAGVTAAVSLVGHGAATLIKVTTLFHESVGCRYAPDP